MGCGVKRGRGFYDDMKRATYFYADENGSVREEAKLMLEQSPFSKGEEM